MIHNGCNHWRGVGTCKKKHSNVNTALRMRAATDRTPKRAHPEQIPGLERGRRCCGHREEQSEHAQRLRGELHKKTTVQQQLGDAHGWERERESRTLFLHDT